MNSTHLLHGSGKTVMENHELYDFAKLIDCVRLALKEFAFGRTGATAAAECSMMLSRGLLDIYNAMKAASLDASLSVELPEPAPNLHTIKFSVIRQAIQNDKENHLTHGAILTLFALLDHAELKGRKLVTTEVPQDVLADEINRHRGSVYRGIESLEASGIIVRTVQGTGGQTTVYEIDIPGEGGAHEM